MAANSLTPADLNYVARKPCGCFFFMAAADPSMGWAEGAAASVADLIRRGIPVDRASTEEIRRGTTQCDKCKPLRPEPDGEEG